MINLSNRFNPSQGSRRRAFNRRVNRMKSVNKILTKRGGIKL